MKEFNVIQGSPEWRKLRLGIPTASEFGRIITPAKGEYASGADAYAAELIAESVGWLSSFQGTPDTVRGNYLEKEAVKWLRLRYGHKTREVGFCLSDCGRYGASPDGLLIEDGSPLEVKCPDLHTFIKWRIEGGLPQQHKAQCHGEMFVTGTDRCLFLAYADSPHIDNMLIEVRRDSFTDKMGECIKKFCDRLHELQDQMLGEEADVLIPHRNPTPNQLAE